MLNPNEIIEENIGTEFIEFEKEVERLSQELEQINVEASIYTSDRVIGIHRDLLEISLAEISWSRYFAIYRTIIGHASTLESKFKVTNENK
jgi:hypothetical protein